MTLTAVQRLPASKDFEDFEFAFVSDSEKHPSVVDCPGPAELSNLWSMSGSVSVLQAKGRYDYEVSPFPRWENRGDPAPDECI